MPSISVHSGAATRVFLSYSRKDSALATRLNSSLERLGIEVFRDVDDTLPSEEWWARLQQLIRQADTILFLLSPSSAASDVCRDEVRYAKELSKRIIPVVVADVDWSAAPRELAKVQAVQLQREDAFDAGLAQLRATLLTDVGWVREHTRLLEVAHRWDERNRPRAELLTGRGLTEAEAWLDRQPASAEPPTRLHHELIRASRASSTRSQRTWLASSLLVSALALSLAGFAYWQRSLAITNGMLATTREAETKTELARVLLKTGEPLPALSSALDGASTLHRIGGQTQKAEATLYDVHWGRHFPIAATRHEIAGTSWMQLVAKSTADAARHDVFCLYRKEGEETCQTLHDGKAQRIASELTIGQQEFEQAESIYDEKIENGDLYTTIDGKKHRILVSKERIHDKDTQFRLSVCWHSHLIVEATWKVGNNEWRHETLVQSLRTDKVVPLPNAPAQGQATPHCHADKKHALITGTSESIAVYNVETGHLGSPSLNDLPTIRYGFFPANKLISLSQQLGIFVFSGVHVWDQDRLGRKLVQPAIYSLQTGRVIAELQGHNGQLGAAVISRSGHQLATVTEDGILRIWDLERILRDTAPDSSGSCRYVKDFDLVGFVPIHKWPSCSIQQYTGALLGYRHGAQRTMLLFGEKLGELWSVDAGELKGPFRLDERLRADMTRAKLLRDGEHIVTIGPERRLHLVNPSSPEQIVDTWGENVMSIGRVDGGEAGDTFIVLTATGFFRVQIPEGERRAIGAAPIADLTAKGHAYFHRHLAIVDQLSEQGERGYMKIRGETGTYHFAGKSLLYCATYDMGWGGNADACAVFDLETLGQIGDRVCLSAMKNASVLACMAPNLDALHLFHFRKHRWLVVAKDDFVVPELAKVSGNISISAESSSGCPDRVLLGYGERTRDGGGIRSQDLLIYDTARETQVMRVSRDTMRKSPMFCTLEPLLSYSEETRRQATVVAMPAVSDAALLADTVARDPKRLTEAYLVRGEALLADRKDVEASAMFAKAVAGDGATAFRRDQAWARVHVDHGEKLIVAADDIADDATAEQMRRSAHALFDAALALLRRDGMPSDLVAAAVIGRGQAHHELKEYLPAIADFREALRLDHEKAATWLWGARASHGIELSENGKPLEGFLSIWTDLLEMSAETRRKIGQDQLKSGSETWESIVRLHASFASAAGDATECDRLAGQSLDPLRQAPGVAFEAIDAPHAIAACTAAIASDPGEARHLYLRGRAHSRAAGIAKDANDEAAMKASHAAAFADFSAATVAGYPMAFSAIANAYAEGAGAEKSEAKAADHHLQMLNRVLHCCWEPVGRHVAEKARSAEATTSFDSAQVGRVVRELTRWSAALGSEPSRRYLGEIAQQGDAGPIEPLPRADFTDLPPWLRD